MEGTISVEGTDTVCPAPWLEVENENLLSDAGAALVPVVIRGPFTEDAENTGAEVLPVDMHPTACVGGTENNALPKARVGGTEKNGSSTSIREGVCVPWFSCVGGGRNPQ